jgi:DNA polymerase-3 subunit epsilon
LDQEQQNQPLDRLALTVFDTETTGLHPGQGDEIISIGAIRVLNGRLIGQELFESLVGTTRPIHPESQKVHGIRAEMLADAPGQADALGRFLQFADNSILVGHNVAFDMRFLDLAGKRHQLQIPRLALDTLLLSAVVYPERDQHSLEAIAERLGVTVLGRHTSLGDALVTAEVLCRLLPLLQQKGIRTLGEAMSASQESWYARLAY